MVIANGLVKLYFSKLEMNLLLLDALAWANFYVNFFSSKSLEHSVFIIGLLVNPKSMWLQAQSSSSQETLFPSLLLQPKQREAFLSAPWAVRWIFPSLSFSWGHVVSTLFEVLVLVFPLYKSKTSPITLWVTKPRRKVIETSSPPH